MYHTLIERGRREIEALFPGFHARLEENGAPRIGFGFNAAVMTPRGWASPAAGLVMHNTNVSRVLLESTMRELFLTTPNVEIRNRRRSSDCSRNHATRVSSAPGHRSAMRER